MTVKIGQTHCRMLFLPLFTSITQKLLFVLFFIYIVQYVTYVLVAEYLFLTTVDKYMANFVTQSPYFKLVMYYTTRF